MTATANPDWKILYAEAFDRFGVVALWSLTRKDDPTPEQALALCAPLRRQGDMSAWRLADRLAKACRAP